MNFIDERYFSEYLRSGLETEQRGYQASGNKGHNGQFEQRYHLLVWSKPIGFEVENGEGYNIEFRGVFHEYWHVFQMAHMDFYNCSDKDDRSTCNFDFDSIGLCLSEPANIYIYIYILEVMASYLCSFCIWTSGIFGKPHFCKIDWIKILHFQICL